MKLNVLLCAGAMAILASCGQNGYVIEGTFSNADDTVSVQRKAYLYSDFSSTADTVDIVDGRFCFKGHVDQPLPYLIGVEGVQGEVEIFLENAKYTAELVQEGPYLGTALVNGGDTQSLYYKIATSHQGVLDKYGLDVNSFMEEYMAEETTDERRAELDGLLQKIYTESDSLRRLIVDEYRETHPLSYFDLSGIYNEMMSMSPDDIAEALKPYKDAAEYASHPIVVRITEYLEDNTHLMQGAPAPDFTVPDTKGKDVTFSSIYPKYKVTMIDFWASWCGPCRNFNPVLVEIYEKYHDKGFEIVGVSMDNDKESWLQAIKDDGLGWIQLSDLNYWNTKPRELYNVSYIPQNILVDSEGKIIASKLGEEELEEVLGEYLGE